jgi:hypothetical protein
MLAYVGAILLSSPRPLLFIPNNWPEAILYSKLTASPTGYAMVCLRIGLAYHLCLKACSLCPRIKDVVAFEICTKKLGVCLVS